MSQRTRTELRDLLLDAGAALIAEHGIGLELAEITYSEVFDYLEATSGVRVTRASVHKRIWPSQRDFQLEVVAEAVRRWDVGDDVPELLDLVAEELEALDGAATVSAVLDHLCRTAGLRALEGFSTARSWRMFNALWSVFEATPVHERTELTDFAEQVRQTYRASLERDRDNWRNFVTESGMALRDDVDDPVMAFSLLSSGLLEGAYLLRFVWDEPDETPVDGWTPFAIGLRAFADAAVDTSDDAGDR